MTLAGDLRVIAETLAREAGDMALRGRRSGDVAATTRTTAVTTAAEPGIR